MKFNPNVPIYLQIMDEFKKDIVSGTLSPGSKVKSVRELALEYEVNPNTVQRALSELEREGLVHANRTAGRFISEDQELLNQVAHAKAAAIVSKFIADIRQLGYNDEEIINLIKQNL